MLIADIKLGRKNPEVLPEFTPEQIRDAFVANLEQYKKDNPVKYEIKKEALAAELAKLEAACVDPAVKEIKKAKQLAGEIKVKEIKKAKQLTNKDE